MKIEARGFVTEKRYGDCGYNGNTTETVYDIDPHVKELRAVSISVVYTPVDPNCKTSDGRYLAIEWKRDAV